MPFIISVYVFISGIGDFKVGACVKAVQRKVLKKLMQSLNTSSPLRCLSQLKDHVARVIINISLVTV